MTNKLFLLIVLMILAPGITVYAVPAAPHFHDLQQPDGAAIIAHQWGDEHSHGWETDSEHTIVFDKVIKGWTYAIHDKDGKLVSSSILVDRAKSPPMSIQKNLRPQQRSLKKVFGMSAASSVTDTSNASLLSSSSQQLVSSATGTKSLPVILIGFSDVPFTKTKADFDNLLFGTSGKSMRNYYLENSYNQLTVNGGSTGVFGPVSSDNPKIYYGENDENGDDLKPGTLVYEAVSKASAAGFMFAPFVDQTKSCYVDVVVVAHQGTGAESGFDTHDIWSDNWDLNSAKYYGQSDYGEYVTNEPCSFPGGGGYIKVNRYTLQPELAVPNGSLIGAGVFAHEYGHALGLPDLYDTDNSSNGAGYWTLMASGSWLGKVVGYGINTYYNTGDSPSHLDPWSKYYLGWINPSIVSGVNQNLPVVAASSPSSDFYMLGSGSPSTGEYFLVENRQKTGFDSYLTGSGLLIWHIDGATISSLSLSNSVNKNECKSLSPGVCSSYSSHYGVALIQRDNSLHLENKSDRGDSTDPFAAPYTFTDSSSPNSKFWSGSASGFGVTAISASVSTMTATFIGAPTCPSATTNEASSVYASTVTLNGTVNDNNALTTVTFEYGLTTGYGSTASGGTISAGSGNTAVSASISGLACNSTYHYRVSATNTVSTSIGVDRYFTTTACVPGAPSMSSVAAGNSRAIIYFSPPGYSGASPIISFTVTPSIGLPVSGDTVPIIITGLSNGVPHTFTVRATNAAGTGPASAASPVVIPGIAIIDDADETGYQLLQSAYEADNSGEDIKLLANINLGGLRVNSSNAKGDVTIKGGFNDVFTIDNGPPSILGKVTLSAGKTSFQKVVVRSP